MISTVKANSCPCFPADCQWPERMNLIIICIFPPYEKHHFLVHVKMNHYSPQQPLHADKITVSFFFPVVSTNTSRGHSELPVRILTTGECTRNRLTLFGNVTVHCKRGIFLWGAIHQTSGLDVAWGSVIWRDPAQTYPGLWDCGPTDLM